LAKRINRLTPRTVAALSETGRYADGGGLYLQISKAGTKAWIFRFTLDGRPRHMGLGPTHTVTLAEARDEALQCRKMLRDGIDPIDARRTKRAARLKEAVSAMTFRKCAESYIKSHAAGWKNVKHARQWSSTLETYAYPIFGTLPVDMIDTGLVMKVIDPIWREKTETASRLRGRIESILDWAMVRGYRKGENPARWKGHLDNLLPAKSRIAKVAHHAALPYAEIGTFMAELRKREGIAALGLELLILTAARTGETIGARWDEFDMENGIWTIPADRMKAKNEHRVPLSAGAINVLEQLGAMRQSDFILPGQQRNRPLSNMAFLQVLRRMGRGDLTAHGFRSTFRDWAAEQTRYPREVAEMALAHTVTNKVEAAYRRGDLFEKRRHLMDDWAQCCSVEGRPQHKSNIVSISRN